MNSIDALSEQLLSFGGVVAHAVVRAVREHGIDGALRARGFRQRIVGNAARDRFGRQTLRRESVR
jgi:hypothetical protein